MNTPNPKVEQLIAALLRKTYEGDVKWRLEDPALSLVRGTSNVIPLYMEAMFMGKRFAVFERRSKDFYDEHEFEWTTDIVFSLVADQTVLWEYSRYSQALGDLFYAAREMVSGIDDLLKGI